MTGAMVQGRVSAVIPVHNRRDTVGRAIRSALAQTHRDLEVIVVDDASTDGTPEAVKQAGGRRVRLLRHERNRGPSAARNTGIAAATGEFVAFLDSDDEWDAAKVERQLAALRARSAGGQGDWAAVYCGFRFERAGRATATIPTLEGRFPAELLAMAAPVAAGSTLLVRRAALDEVGGFDAGLRRQEDIDVLLRLFRRHRVAVVPEPLTTIHWTADAPADVVVQAKRLFLHTFQDEIAALGPRKARQVRAAHWCQAAAFCAAERRVGATLACLGRMLASGSVAWRRLPGVAVAFVRGRAP